MYVVLFLILHIRIFSLHNNHLPIPILQIYACVFLLEHYSGEQHVNIGTGKEVTIKELAEIVKHVVGYTGEIVWNNDMPDGTPRKLTDVTKLHNLGWTHQVELEEGVQLAYDWFKENVQNARL